MIYNEQRGFSKEYNVWSNQNEQTTINCKPESYSMALMDINSLKQVSFWEKKLS